MLQHAKVLQHALAVVPKLATVFSQKETFVDSLEDLEPVMLFDFHDRAADCRLCKVQSVGRAGHGVFPAGRTKDFQMVKRHNMPSYHNIFDIYLITLYNLTK